MRHESLLGGLGGVPLTRDGLDFDTFTPMRRGTLLTHADLGAYLRTSVLAPLGDVGLDPAGVVTLKAVTRAANARVRSGFRVLARVYEPVHEPTRWREVPQPDAGREPRFDLVVTPGPKQKVVQDVEPVATFEDAILRVVREAPLPSLLLSKEPLPARGAPLPSLRVSMDPLRAHGVPLDSRVHEVWDQLPRTLSMKVVCRDPFGRESDLTTYEQVDWVAMLVNPEEAITQEVGRLLRQPLHDSFVRTLHAFMREHGIDEAAARRAAPTARKDHH